MAIKLVRQEGYIDEANLKTLLQQYDKEADQEKLTRISNEILRNGFLTLEQLMQSAKDFFLQDVSAVEADTQLLCY